jgi:hypothetical protein
MAESLEDFLGSVKKENLTEVNGSLSCQECEERASVGWLDEEKMILTYRCSNNHQSKVKI